MTIKQWNDMTGPEAAEKATADAQRKPATHPAEPAAPADANLPTVDPLAGVRNALGMEGATEDEMVARIKELRG